MILYKGQLYETSCQGELLRQMERNINDTRSNRRLDISKVIEAVDCIRQKLEAGDYDEKLASLGMEGMEEQLKAVIAMTDRRALEYRLSVELGELKDPLITGQPLVRMNEPKPEGSLSNIETQILPLGTLFHIAAGNREGLPVYSVLEGLLTGNVNILKLPQADQGLSIEIIRTLVEVEPSIAEFVYVFDTPSSDLDAMRSMAAMSDGIVVWGGEEAVAAVRRFAPVGAQIIEWGHKLSFAYLSGLSGIKEERLNEELQALAEHIVSTRQLLCSSCQVIYLDQEEMEEIYAFCRRFLPYLERAAARFPAKTPGMQAELSLRRYCDTLNKIILEESIEEQRVFSGKNCSLTACSDRELELSDMFGNCLVKRLPKREMMQVLRRNKGYLQTAGLLCPETIRHELTALLADCGLVRITTVGRMSETFLGEAHDGDYALRRYVRVVDVEN